MTRVPAHEGLTPRDLEFCDDLDTLAMRVGEVTAACRIESVPAIPGATPRYFRLWKGDRKVFFGKAVRNADAAHELRAASLAAAAAQAGHPAVALDAGPLILDEAHALLVWPWMAGNFFDGSEGQLRSLGRDLARLHAFFRDRCDAIPEEQVRARWTRQWSEINGLDLRNAGLPPLVQQELEALRQQAPMQLRALMNDGQRLHADLHPGNVLFRDTGEVAAILDFEEAVCAWGSQWIDLAWVLERFCFVGSDAWRAQSLAWAFLRAYGEEAPRPLATFSGIVAAALRWKNLHAVALLSASEAQASPWLEGERMKFIGLLEKTIAWTPVLLALERRFCAEGLGTHTTTA